ncbi:MAG: protease inhibitor I42 family protein [Dehalococcoidales bacterium]
MKRFWLPFILFILVVCLVAGYSCGARTDVDTRIGIEAVEKISTRVNQEFSIAREFDLNSGYMWRETYDESMLELVDTAIDTNREGEGENERIVLSQVFRFRALKKGKTEILLEHRRLTLEGPIIARQEIISVNIE